MSTKETAGNRLPASMFFGWGILAGLFLFTTEGHAQARFPTEVVGHWCGVHDAYDRFDVNETEYEEGDGLCRLVKSRITQGAKVVGFDLDLRCETGAEGKKPFAASHKFTAFETDNTKYMLRAGHLCPEGPSALQTVQGMSAGTHLAVRDCDRWHERRTRF